MCLTPGCAQKINWAASDSPGELAPLLRFIDLMASGMARTRSSGTSNQISLADEMAGSASPQHRIVPQITRDNAGINGASVIFATRPTVNCGSAGSIETRITDCLSKNPSTAFWDGRIHGNAAESTWSLVSRTGASGRETWRDNRTQMIWSDRLTTASNWCHASGVSGGGPLGEDDPDDMCDNPLNQDQVHPESYCAEFEDFQSAMPGEDFDGGVYSDEKAGLGKKSTTSVSWRLPTNADWTMAELGGIRYVVPNINGPYWSATIANYMTGRAYTYTAGGVSVGFYFQPLRDNSNPDSGGIDSGYAVRCIGSSLTTEP